MRTFVIINLLLIMQVLPVINCLDFECVKSELVKIQSFHKDGEWITIDIADGRFTFHKTWNDPAAWRELAPDYKLEVHLMVEDPEIFVGPWLAAGAKRLIIHIEALKPGILENISAAVRGAGAELMLSSNPDTPPEKIRPYLQATNYFQVLAVNPGLAGQKFLPVVLEKIKFLRREVPDAMIEVDGGMNPETAKMVKDAGADILAVASYILKSIDQKKAYEELKEI